MEAAGRRRAGGDSDVSSPYLTLSGTFQAVNGLNGGTAQVKLRPFLPHYGDHKTSLPLSSFCIIRFRCECPPGYFGTLCDLDVNECEVSPCRHEGICINTPGGFKCVCRPGYSGRYLPTSLPAAHHTHIFTPQVTWRSIGRSAKLIVTSVLGPRGGDASLFLFFFFLLFCQLLKEEMR